MPKRVLVPLGAQGVDIPRIHGEVILNPARREREGRGDLLKKGKERGRPADLYRQLAQMASYLRGESEYPTPLYLLIAEDVVPLGRLAMACGISLDRARSDAAQLVEAALVIETSDEFGPVYRMRMGEADFS